MPVSMRVGSIVQLVLNPVTEEAKTTRTDYDVYYFAIYKQNGNRPGIDAVDQVVRPAEIARLKTEFIF